MIETIIATKANALSSQALMELLYCSLSLLAYRGLANADDLRLLKALVDELPREQPMLKVA